MSTSTSLKMRRRRSGVNDHHLQLDLVRGPGLTLPIKRRRRERGFEVPLQCGRSAVVRRREQRACGVDRCRCRRLRGRTSSRHVRVASDGATRRSWCVLTLCTAAIPRSTRLAIYTCAVLLLGGKRQALRQPATALQKLFRDAAGAKRDGSVNRGRGQQASSRANSTGWVRGPAQEAAGRRQACCASLPSLKTAAYAVRQPLT